MNEEKYEKITSYIANCIAQNPPVVSYSKTSVEIFRKSLTPAIISNLKEKGFLGFDIELFYVLDRFFRSIDLYEVADEEYISKLYENARQFSAKEFLSNPYVKNIKFSTVSSGNFLLTTASYEKGEIFQYDMPYLNGDYPVLKLGFFNANVQFPTIYEGNVPWMSVCPSEIYSMKYHIADAKGKVLVLGLGLGYYPYMISLKEDVESITIIEVSDDVVNLFNKNILPQFLNKNKIKVIRADAIRFLAGLKNGEYDYCFADIWENQFDGAEYYNIIKQFEKCLPDTKFSYWIENEILWYLSQI